MFTARKRSLGQGNNFTSVCQEFCSHGGGCYPSMHCRWHPSMPCSRSPGGCYPSMHCRWYPSMPYSRFLGGACSGGGSAPGGSAPKGGVWWRPPRTATAVGGMHPTGMHSCFISVCLFTMEWGITGPMSFPGGRVSLVLCPFQKSRVSLAPCPFQGVGYLWSHVLSRGVGYLWSHVPSGVGEYTLP